METGNNCYIPIDLKTDDLRAHSVSPAVFPRTPSTETLNYQKAVNARFTAWASYWNEIYEHSDVYALIHQERLQFIFACIDKIGLPAGSNVLDVGCGGGLISVRLAKRGYVVKAVDAIAAMTNSTRNAAARENVADRVTVSMSDAHNLAFPDKTFSLVVAAGITPWLHSLEKAVQEIARVLKPGGWLITSADNRWRLNHMLDPRFFPLLQPVKTRVQRFLNKLGICKFPLSTGSARMYTSKEFDGVLLGAGFEKTESMMLGFGPFTFFNRKLLQERMGIKLHQRLQTAANRGIPIIRSTGSQYLVLARKLFKS